VHMLEAGGRTRYRFLETVRQFAQTQLEISEARLRTRLRPPRSTLRVRCRTACST